MKKKGMGERWGGGWKLSIDFWTPLFPLGAEDLPSLNNGDLRVGMFYSNFLHDSAQCH